MTFKQKIAAGFAVMVAVAALTSTVAIYSLQAVVTSKDRVIDVNAQNLTDAAKLDAVANSAVAEFRMFQLTPEDPFRERWAKAVQEFTDGLGRISKQVYTETGKQMVKDLERASSSLFAAQDRAITQRRKTANVALMLPTLENEILPKREELSRRLQIFVGLESRLLEEGERASTDRASMASTLAIALAVAAVIFAILAAFFLTRALSRQIASAVLHVRSSSSELQTAATQQAAGARESATAMSEISTTINELLATSRQIAGSAQRVVQIAQETALAVRAGDQTVEKTQGAITSIQRQVSVIVDHMLDLGQKSQRMGGILDIINELAEQTNILAINATIEAAGAGEAGKRFAVVGDEVRKLADRVSGSATDMRTLIDEIRAAVNSTVMATEGGAKAVDNGLRDFAEVTTALGQIGDRAKVTTDAAREIEFSTKQQMTAVEQVNLAVTGAAQATRETEASSAQTLQTAAQLAQLSEALSRIVQPRVQA